METIGTMALQKKINRDSLKKYLPREFFYYSKRILRKRALKGDYPDHIPDTWNEFIEKEIIQKNGESGFRWYKKHFSKVFE